MTRFPHREVTKDCTQSVRLQKVINNIKKIIMKISRIETLICSKLREVFKEHMQFLKMHFMLLHFWYNLKRVHGPANKAVFAWLYPCMNSSSILLQVVYLKEWFWCIFIVEYARRKGFCFVLCCKSMATELPGITIMMIITITYIIIIMNCVK